MSARVAAGAPEPLGVTPIDGGINIAVYSANASSIELCLFGDGGEVEHERILLHERTGDVHHAYVAQVPVGTRYGLRAHGPYAPELGHRFNPAKLLVDPYALQLDRPFALHDSQLGFRDGDAESATHSDPRDSAPTVPKALVVDRHSLRGAPSPVRVPWPDSVIYELHVRGYSRQHPAIAESIRGTFAALAEPAAIRHLRELGITTVELMPAMAWIDERHLPPLGLTNYWGYNPIAMLAPDPRLAPGGWAEVRAATDALHAAGIEVLLDVVLNHSGESDQLGPTLAFRGLDNASYYRLRPDEPSRYIDDMGCGNCLALDRAPLVRLAMDCLRTWMELGGMDGFRFDLATALGRHAEGFDPAAPLLAAIAQDPLLREAKLIAEPWDLGPGGYRAGRFSAAIGEWNDRFRDDVRRFWRGDAGLRSQLATRLAGSADVFAAKHRPSRSINFITAHDGFTLADLVAYSTKHNDANGESNRDGTEANYSWNHGVEGASDDAQVDAARRRDQRNLLATLLLARGTPMLSMGAELGFSQDGNNNAYAQDNPHTWIDWAKADPDLIRFTRALLALRRARLGFRNDAFLEGAVIDPHGFADVEWRCATGALVEAAQWQHADVDTLIAVFCVPVEGASSERTILALHRGGSELTLHLPAARAGWHWSRALDSARPVDNADRATGDITLLAGRSVAVFVESQGATGSEHRHDVDAALLARLAGAADIAPAWWDVAGTRHVVTADTQRALLAAMGLQAHSAMQTRDCLIQLAQTGERRLLPLSRIVRSGEIIRLRVAIDPVRRPPQGGVTITDDANQIVAQIPHAELALQAARDLLGRRYRVGELVLPAALGIGRYRVRFDASPDVFCQLSVVPSRCHRPDALDDPAARRFGITVQAYSLRRTCDFGVGDFSAIGDFAVAAARTGAATVGINPLHMLFPRDRERASPYHPSDRRFLDPLYLDPADLVDLPGFAEARRHWPGDAALQLLNARESIDYAAMWTLKEATLHRVHCAFQHSRRDQPEHPAQREFAAFIASGGEALRRFAAFHAIAQTRPTAVWSSWQDGLHDARSQAVDDFAAQHADAVDYHLFLQWLCDRQLDKAAGRARDAGLALGLYRDLAVGAAPDGAEAWANAHLAARDASIGAPPDPLAPQGQVWNLPPPNPLAWREHDFVSFRQAVAANMRHAGMLRIDHALGLARLFWVPKGGRPADGAYVAYPLDDLLGLLADESERQHCAVVGEDLGTVPDGLREKLATHGILRYQVMLLERDGVGFIPPADYSANAVACACTHDLPPLAGWWDGADIRERQSLQLIGADEAEQLLARRAEEKRLLVAAIQRDGIAVPGDLGAAADEATLAALHAWLACAPSALRLAQAEDLCAETIGQNLPGTDRERPNWRRRLRYDSATLFAQGMSLQIIQRLGNSR